MRGDVAGAALDKGISGLAAHRRSNSARYLLRKCARLSSQRSTSSFGLTVKTRTGFASARAGAASAARATISAARPLAADPRKHVVEQRLGVRQVVALRKVLRDLLT